MMQRMASLQRSPFRSLLCYLALSHGLMLVDATLSACPYRPAGRLHSQEYLTCPVPRDLSGFWDPKPRCFGATSADAEAHCIFASPAFRGHGISLVTSPQVAAHLVGMQALDDQPPPPAARRRDAGGPAYQVVDVAGRGKGVVARRKIRRGEIVMVDVPALLIGMPVLESLREHHRRRMIRQAIDLLPAETRRAVYGLQRGAGYEIDALLGTNTGSVVLGDDQTHLALFPKIARINHECRPNAHYIFSPRRLTAEVVAYRAIEPGEEVTISYVPLATKHTVRRRALKENWGIHCACSLCHGEAWRVHDSESARRRIVELKGTGAHARSEAYFQDAINIAHEWNQFAEDEGVADPEPEFHDTLAQLHARLAAETGRAADGERSKRYARMAVDGWVRLGSVDGEALEMARRLLRELEGR